MAERRAEAPGEDRSLTSFLSPRYWHVWIGLGIMRLSLLLPYRVQIRLGRALGWLPYWLLPRRRMVALRNIETCFPELDEAAHLRMVKEHFKSLGASAVEMALGWWASDKKLERLMTLEGAEHVTEALAGGKGAILLSAHFTTMECSGRTLAKHIGPFRAMYRPGRNALVNEMLKRGRERSAAAVIAKDDVRIMLKTLKANMPVWYAADQAYVRKGGALVPFFSVPAMTNVATSRIARVSGAPVLPYLPLRLPGGRGYLLTVLPPLEGFPSEDPVTDAAVFNRIIEDHIRKDPSQYFWVHRKFKSRPAPYPDIYENP